MDQRKPGGEPPLRTLRWPKLKRHWAGLTVASTYPIANAYATLPEGTRFRVTNYYRGLELISQGCSRCGAQMHVRRVPPMKVKLLDIPENREILAKLPAL